MTALDWGLVVSLNGAVILYSLLRGRETKSSSDWFLAGRTLPWWIIGLSLYATAIDSTDLIADSGGSYNEGMRILILNWVGVVGGWFLTAHFIAPPMYRAGMYTNAEYLEARFGPLTRAASVVVQVLYRTTVMGMIAQSLFLALTVICGFESGQAWITVVVIAGIATIYTMLGGLRSVAVTDALQSIIMLLASMVIFAIIWKAVGGWSGVESKLTDYDETMAVQMLHTGGGSDASESGDSNVPPAWLSCLSLVLAGLAYAVVNHTQTMRMFGARSLWDLKMSVVLAGAIMVVVNFLNLSMGIMGRALYPDPSMMPVADALQRSDTIFPLLVDEYATVGLKGIVVAGLLAASFSTYDSMGSTLSALITRDFYGRLLVTDRTDEHYLFVGRWLTPVIIFGSFLYLPLLYKRGMIYVYLDIVSSFVIPLLTIYLMGTFTRVHRWAGGVGLAVGVAYGIVALTAPWLKERMGVSPLPPPLRYSAATAPMCMFVTAMTMVATSLVSGWQRGELLREESGQWLRESQARLRVQIATTTRHRSAVVPALLGLIVVMIGCFLSFYVFW